LKAYDEGEIPCKDAFSKYFEWKSGRAASFPFTAEDTITMCAVASDLLDPYYAKHPLSNDISLPYDDDDPVARVCVLWRG